MSLTYRIIPSRCVECMACVRACPVEAVQVQEGTVEIVEESCIECGLCQPACGHEAIEATGDLATARELIEGGEAALILATESAVHFHPATPDQLLGACRAAGFRHVQPGVLGDELVAREYLKLWEASGGRTTIRSTSPIIVEYVQREYPELVPYLAPVVTPAEAQARYLRAQHGADLSIVYCGVAPPGPSEEEGSAIDASITFAELETLLRERGADPLAQPDEPGRDVPERGRHLSIAGGMPAAVLQEERALSKRLRKLRGLEQVAAVADAVTRAEGESRLGFVDLLPYDGDLDHPVMGPKDGLYWRREIAERAEAPRSDAPVIDEGVELDLSVDRRPSAAADVYTDADVESLIDREIGRAPSGAHWDCGACGFARCADFARAALRGRAGLEICPYYQQRRYRAAMREAAYDELTGLYTYRVLKSRLAEEVARVDRTGGSAAVLFLDLDGLKQINDRLGHPAGNEVLKRVGEEIRSSIRGTDFAARYGGDEFVAILVDADRPGAVRVAEQIRERIALIRAKRNGIEIPVSVSTGIKVVHVEDAAIGPDRLLEAADMALLEAKRSGGDAVMIDT